MTDLTELLKPAELVHSVLQRTAQYQWPLPCERTGAEVCDVRAFGGQIDVLERPRIETENTHGTGCTLASAIAAGLAQKLDLRAAVVRGLDYMREAIRTAPGYGGGHGPLNHGHTIPEN